MKVAVFVVFIIFIGLLAGCQNPAVNSNPSPEQYLKTSMAADGYEVMAVGITSNNEAYLKARSFGDILKQVDDHLTRLSIAYPYATKYKVQIISSGKDCSYEIDGVKFRKFVDSVTTEVPTEDALALMLDIEKEIAKSERCY